MSTTREAGDRGEAMAAEYLRENGYEILASQFRILIVYTVNDFLGRKRNFLPIRLPVDAGYYEFCHFKYSPFSFLTVFLYIKVSIPNGR